jgi:hypothetical protein
LNHFEKLCTMGHPNSSLQTCCIWEYFQKHFIPWPRKNKI